MDRKALAKQLLAGPIREIVRQKAQALSYQPGFSPSDAQDIEQDFLVRLICALPKYNRRRGSFEAFIRSVLRNAAADIVRKRRAEKRTRRREETSLHASVGDDDSEDELHELLGHDERRPTQRSAEEIASLRLDLSLVLSSAPEAQRRLAEHLTSDCVSGVARLLRRPRTTLNDQIRQMRKRFEDGGLRDYL